MTLKTILFCGLTIAASVVNVLGQAAGFVRVNSIPVTLPVTGRVVGSIPATFHDLGMDYSISTLPTDLDFGATRITRATIVGLTEVAGGGNNNMIMGIGMSGSLPTFQNTFSPLGGAPYSSTLTYIHDATNGSILAGPTAGTGWSYTATKNVITVNPSLAGATGEHAIWFSMAITSAANVGRIDNISSRGWVNGSSNQNTLEIIITGPNTLKARVRLRGPSLATWGITPNPADPKLIVENYSTGVTFSNDNWATVTGPYQGVAGTPYEPTAYPTEAALIYTFGAGHWAFKAEGNAGQNGIVLIDFTLM